MPARVSETEFRRIVGAVKPRGEPPKLPPIKPKLRILHALIYLLAFWGAVLGETTGHSRWSVILLVVMSYDLHMIRNALWDILAHLTEEEG